MFMNTRCKNCLLLVTLLIFFLRLEAQPSKDDSSILPIDPSVRIGRLSNGLTYYIRKNSEPKDRAELYLVNKVGSLQEDDDQQGLAHFTEHMAFNGTRDFPKNSLIDHLQKAGVRFGADLNAYTSFDETVYQLPLPTDDTKLFYKGIDILLNWAGFVSFENQEIDLERGVILEEERQRGKNANDRMSRQIYPVLMAGSKYAHRLPIGKTEIITDFEYNTIRRFYKDWYRPNLQAVIAVGDFDVVAVERYIKEKFSVLKNPKKERSLHQDGIPGNKQPLVKIVTDDECSYTSVMVFYKHPESIIRTKQDYRRALITSMINTMFNDRLQEIKNNGNAPFLAASGKYGGFIGDQSSFTLNVAARDADHLQEAVQTVMDEAFRMKSFGFTKTELHRASQNLLSAMARQYKEKDKVPSSFYVNEYQKHFLKGEAIPGLDYEYNFYNQTIPSITQEEVNRLASTLITKENRVLILQANTKDNDKLPTEATLLSWTDDSGRALNPYVDRVVNEPLMAKMPKPGTINSERDLGYENVTELTLSNGATVVIKPTDFKNDQILFSALSPGGQSLAEDNHFRSAQYASSLINASGLAAFDDVQLNKLLAGKNFSVVPYIGRYFEGLSGYTTLADLETALQVTHLYFTAPRRDTAVFQTMVRDIRTKLATRYTNPVAIFQDTLTSVMHAAHPRSKMLSLSEVDSLSQDIALDFYGQRFSNASDFTFFFVGNVDVKKIKSLAVQYLASLPAAQFKENYKDHGFKPLTGMVTRTIHKGLEDKATVALVYHGNYTYSNEENLQLRLLNHILELRLLDRLREKEGGVYSPAVELNYENIPSPHYTFRVSFSCSSANADHLIDAAKEEIELIRSHGITESELDKFKAERTRQLEVQSRKNSFWLGYLEGVYKKEHTLDFLKHYPSILNALSKEGAKKAAKKYLNNTNYIRLVLLPEKTEQ